MLVVLKDDIITNVSLTAGVELLAPLPPGVGLERIRVVDLMPIDLATLSSLWVRKENGAFVLHATDLPGAQLVSMTYADRRNLIDDAGVYRVKTAEEIAAIETATYNLLLKSALRARLIPQIGDDCDQLADLWKLVFLIVKAVDGDVEAQAALHDIRLAIDTIYSTADIKAKLEAVAVVLAAEVPAYYTERI